ncbi:hypothetical protein BGZ49_002818, partial [Haplosporangium sp. Z 27]
NSGYEDVNHNNHHHIQDRNSDMDQDLVLANAPLPQQQHHRSHRREGMSSSSGVVAGLMHYSSIDNDLREQHYTQKLHQYQQQQHYPYSADRNSPTEYQQQQQKQQYHHYQQPERYSSHNQYPSPASGGDSGVSAYQHQHHQRQQLQQNLNHNYHSYHREQHGENGRYYHHNTHAEMNCLEAMFPPLHDPVVVVENKMNQTIQSTDPIVVDHHHPLLQKQPMVVVSAPPSTSPSPNGVAARRQSHLVPPPIVIPKDLSLQAQKHQQQKQQCQGQENLKKQQQLPSPAQSAASPESPSSLAIHLYVHHHHHHHSQQQEQQQEHSPPLSTNSLANPSAPPLLLLSPLTIPLETSLPSPPLGSEPEIKTTTTNAVPVNSGNNNSNVPSSPPSPTPEVLPLAAPRQVVSLLPPLTIPPSRAAEVNNNNIVSPTTPPVNGTSEAERLPWFTHPNSLANSNASTKANDISRLYVHAAHHLHSHQPIRKYVLMKMMMTQAELVQYGRLRAEMPRAPGPSTGAQPKRTGFGSIANTGLEARPKIPSKLGIFVMNMPNIIATPTTTTSRSFSEGYKSTSSSSPLMSMPIEGPEGLVLKSRSMRWTQSLSSLVGFSKSSKTATKRRAVSISEANLYPAKRFEELELGEQLTATTTKRTIARRKIEESENDGDVEMESSDQYDDDDDDDGDSSLQSYWSLLRKKNNNGGNRKRAASAPTPPRFVDLKQPSFSSAVSPVTGKSPNKIKQHARRRTGTFSSSSTPATALGSSTSLSPIQVSGRISASLTGHNNSATTLSFIESYGFSSMMMLSLFLFFWFLLEGTNQHHSIQSALQSIIL